MGLDTRYIPLNYLETYFVDKDTAAPLTAGIVTFYKDQARTVKKNIYQLSGTPPNYTYTALPNPCVLNNAGCFIDASGNDIVPYAFPYDSNDDIELYYITVYSNDGYGSPAVLQWTREGQPNVSEEQASNEFTLPNYVSDGQFLTHNFLQDNGLISGDLTPIARGGWYYSRSAGSVATDIISFPRFGTIVASPTSNPRYACRIKCTAPDANDTFKFLELAFPNVNKFASTTQFYTLSFSAQSNTLSAVTADIKLRKYFGGGGSATTITTVKSGITIGSSYQTFSIPFIFGDNIGKTLGTGDDDEVDIEISLPPNAVFDVSITDVSLLPGELEVNQFPIETNSQTISKSIAGELPIPASDGSDLYLPIVLDPSGLRYSDAEIGKICVSGCSAPGVGEESCDGTMVKVADYDDDGIPYNRLHKKIYNYTFNLPQYGTGAGFVWAKQVSAIPPAPTFVASYASSINADSGGGILTGTAHGGAAVASGKLDLAHNDNRYVGYDAAKNADFQQKGTVKFKLTPNYSGSPGTNRPLFSVSAAVNSKINLIALWHSESGNLRIDICDKNGKFIADSFGFGFWSPVSSTEYQFELIIDITTGNTILKINGSQFGSALNNSGIRDSNIHVLYIGQFVDSPASYSNFLLRDLEISNDAPVPLGDYLIVTANTAGALTNASDGSVATGFTFNNIKVGNATYDFKTSIDSLGTIYIENLSGGASFASPTAGTSGFTVGYFRESSVVSPGVTSIVSVEVSSIAALAGAYFTVANTATDFYVWFTVDGSGADPAPGGTGIEIDLLSAHTIDDVRQIIKDALAGFYIFNVTMVGGGAIPAGAYFNFYAPSNKRYYIWYKVNGVGIDPAIANATGILVNIKSSDLDADVAFGTMFVLNNQTYQFPDLRGCVLRGWLDTDYPDLTKDPSVELRNSWCTNLAGNTIGSSQYDIVQRTGLVTVDQTTSINTYCLYVMKY